MKSIPSLTKLLSLAEQHIPARKRLCSCLDNKQWPSGWLWGERKGCLDPLAVIPLPAVGVGPWEKAIFI